MKIPTTYLNSKANSSNQITKFNKAIYFQYFTRHTCFTWAKRLKGRPAFLPRTQPSTGQQYNAFFLALFLLWCCEPLSNISFSFAFEITLWVLIRCIRNDDAFGKTLVHPFTEQGRFVSISVNNPTSGQINSTVVSSAMFVFDFQAPRDAGCVPRTRKGIWGGD